MSTLIEKIEEAKTKADEAYWLALQQYEVEQANWRADVADAIERLSSERDLPEVHRDRWNGTYSWVVPLDLDGDKPEKPREPNHSGADRDLGLLRATSDEVLTIGTDSNLARYL